MKIIPALWVALALTVTSGIAQEKLKLDEANSVKSYTPAQFLKEVAGDPHDGTLVRIKFNGRTPTLSAGPHGTKIGTVENRDIHGYTESTSVMDVEVPPAGLPWFQHVNVYNYQVYDRLAVKTYVVYGRVKVDAAGKATVRLVGLEIKHDLDGDSIVWDQTSSSP